MCVRNGVKQRLCVSCALPSQVLNVIEIRNCATSQDNAGVQTLHQHLVKRLEVLVKLHYPIVVVFCSTNNKFLYTVSTRICGSGSGTVELKKWTKSLNVWGPSIFSTCLFRSLKPYWNLSLKIS